MKHPAMGLELEGPEVQEFPPEVPVFRAELGVEGPEEEVEGDEDFKVEFPVVVGEGLACCEGPSGVGELALAHFSLR